MDDQMFFDDYLLDEEDDEVEQRQQNKLITQQSLLEEYANLQKIIAVTDRVDLDIVDEKTGKMTHFKQVRFSGGNNAKH
jgi:hypothetical protein